MKIDFQFETKYGIFRDAIYLPDDHTYTEDQILEMKFQRKDNWISVIESPSLLIEEQSDNNEEEVDKG